MVHAERGQRLGAAHRRARTGGHELVVVSNPWLQPSHIHFHGEVALGASAGAATDHHVAHAWVSRYTPAHVHRVAGAADARPQQHAVGQGVATGHAVLEDAIECVLAGGGLSEPWQSSGSGCGSGGYELAAGKGRGHGFVPALRRVGGRFG